MNNETMALRDNYIKQLLSWIPMYPLEEKHLSWEFLRLLTACVFLLAGWRCGPVHLDLLTEEEKVGESKAGEKGQTCGTLTEHRKLLSL